MNDFAHGTGRYIPRARTSVDRVRLLVVDMYQIDGAHAYGDWRELIVEFARQWLARHPQQRSATLWESREYSELFSGGWCWRGACSANLPEAFLLELAAFLNEALGGHVKLGVPVFVSADEGWQPYLHVEAGKVWDRDGIQMGVWLEPATGSASPCCAESSAESGGNAFSFHIEHTQRSAQETEQRANKVEFEAVLKSRDKDEIEHYIRENADKLCNPELFLNGDTPLHMAALAGHTDACRQLLGHVDPSIRNCAQRTPLIHLAKYRRHESYGRVIELLVSTIDAADDFGRTALMHAALGTVGLRGNTRLVKSLAYHGADMTCTDHEGRTALQLAMRDNANGGNLAVVELLKRFTIAHAALQFFNAQYDYYFNRDGVFTLHRRDDIDGVGSGRS